MRPVSRLWEQCSRPAAQWSGGWRGTARARASPSAGHGAFWDARHRPPVAPDPSAQNLPWPPRQKLINRRHTTVPHCSREYAHKLAPPGASLRLVRGRELPPACGCPPPEPDLRQRPPLRGPRPTNPRLAGSHAANNGLHILGTHRQGVGRCGHPSHVRTHRCRAVQSEQAPNCPTGLFPRFLGHFAACLLWLFGFSLFLLFSLLHRPPVGQVPPNRAWGALFLVGYFFCGAAWEGAPKSPRSPTGRGAAAASCR